MINLPWLEEADLFDSSVWESLDDEIEGTTPDMCWMRNVVTAERALFKPDTFKGNEAYREYVVSKIASFLKIPCAKICVGELLGQFGCLSYDCNTERRFRVADGYSLYRCDSYFNNKKSDSGNRVYDSLVEISFESLRQYVTEETEIDMVRMMFLDCLVLNPDRHPGNFSFFINFQRAISGLMPLYDHGLCMRSDLRDVSLFPYSGIQEISFTQLYERISTDYPDIVNPMMALIKSEEAINLLIKLECLEFIQNRISKLTTKSKVKYESSLKPSLEFRRG